MNHIIIDLEMNTTPKESGMKNEIIEIGAVKLDDLHNEIDRFHSYVYPENGEITGIITELTGIRQSDVEGAPVFNDAMALFYGWIGDEPATFYSWSNCDKKQFEYEGEFKGHRHEKLKYMLDNWIDIQAEYDRTIGTSHTVALENALKSAGVDMTGKPHTALGDAVNTAELFKILKNDELCNKRLGSLIEMFGNKSISSSLAEMFPEMAGYLDKDEDENEDKGVN